MFNWNKKEEPFFTGISRGMGGFGFGKSASASSFAAAETSGGVIITSGLYTYHVFHTEMDEPTTFINSTTRSEFTFLMLGGGGGGGARYGSGRGSCGGGGAGGYVYGTNKIIPAGIYEVGIGTGGLGPITSLENGLNGSDSTFWGFTAKGGGGGGAADFANASGSGIPGGCGGGANEDYSENPNTGGTATQPTTPQPSVGGGSILYGGYSGGNSGAYPAQAGGGGGINGAGRPGAPPTSTYGNGGPGKAFPDFSSPIIAPAIPTSNNLKTGSPFRDDFISAVGPTGLYGGGGGGVAYPGSPQALGGIGGGGAGGSPGKDFTGGGAGGAYPGIVYGGNGIVILRYPT